MAADRTGRWRRAPLTRGLLSLPAFLTVATACLLLLLWGPSSPPLRYLLLALVAVPVALPLALLLLRWSAAITRGVATRMAVRRARASFRVCLRAARHHPELVDVERLREAANVLSSHVTEAQLQGFPEVAEAARHPYAPIRGAGVRVLQAAAVRSERSNKAPSSNPPL